MSWMFPTSSSEIEPRALFTSVADGNLAMHVGDDPALVTTHRVALAKKLAIPVGSLRFMNQVHGDRVVVADLSTPDADGLITSQSQVALVVMVADCIPLLLTNESASIVAAVHVGRRGLVNGVAGVAVGKMRKLGARQVRALMGPAICGRCYEVPDLMQQEVCSVAPAARSTTLHGTPGLDIRAGLQEQLANVGVDSTIDSRCTYEDEELFSYRRNNRTGRFAGVIMVA